MLIRMLIEARNEDAMKLATVYPEEMSVLGKMRHNKAYYAEVVECWESAHGSCKITMEVSK